MDTRQIAFMVIIGERERRDELLHALSALHIHLINIIYGKSTVTDTLWQSALGVVHENNRVVITCLLADEHTGEVFQLLREQFNFDNPNTGIAFTMPVGKLAF